MKNTISSSKVRTELIRLAEVIDLNEMDLNSEDSITQLLQSSIKYICKLKREVKEEEVKKEPRVKKIISKAKQLEEEVNQTLYTIEDASKLKKKNNKLLETLNNEKEKRNALENFITSQSKKIELLVEHIEKLVTFLRVENTLRTKAFEANRLIFKENKKIVNEMETKVKAIRTQKRVIEEITQGSKILEDQLLMMDNKFLELKQKLDTYREHFNRENKRTKKEFNELRLKYSLANNGKILDSVKIPTNSYGDGRDDDYILTNNTLMNSGKKDISVMINDTSSPKNASSSNDKWNLTKLTNTSSLSRPQTATSPHHLGSLLFKTNPSIISTLDDKMTSDFDYNQPLKNKSRSLVSLIRPSSAAIISTDHILDKIKRKSFNTKRTWEGEELTALLNTK